MRKLFLLIALTAGLSSFAQTTKLPFGNPSHATADAKSADNYLLEKPEYTLSYNNSKGTPNWVSWTVRKQDIGTAARQNDFHTETDLPSGFQRVTPADYDNSGYDRGHMCDSKDRTASVATNQATFSMANMQPQAKKLNEVTWKALEDYSRTLRAGTVTECALPIWPRDPGSHGNDHYSLKGLTVFPDPRYSTSERRNT